jgi:hypothetical protein
MKTTLFVIAGLFLIAALGFAQTSGTSSSYGLGYGIHRYTITDGVITETSDFQGLGLHITNFIGEELGFYQRIYLGLATSVAFTYSDGSNSVTSDRSPIDVPVMNQIMMVGPGYRMRLDRAQSLTFAGGLSITALISLDESVPIGWFTLGAGATTDYSYTLGALRLTAGIGVNYDFYQLLDLTGAPAGIEFVNAFSLAPHVSIGF